SLRCPETRELNRAVIVIHLTTVAGMCTPLAQCAIVSLPSMRSISQPGHDSVVPGDEEDGKLDAPQHSVGGEPFHDRPVDAAPVRAGHAREIHPHRDAGSPMNHRTTLDPTRSRSGHRYRHEDGPAN